MKKALEAFPNELLSYERERRHWTQEEVAGYIGAPDPQMVGRWERGITRPTTHYLQQLVALFDKSARELGFVRKGEVPFWLVPYRQNVYFTGREALFEQIHTHFSAQPCIVPLALSGLGGVGKSQAALEYIYRYGHEYHTVAWIRADSPDLVISGYAALADLLKLPDCQQADQQRMVDMVKQWLSTLTRWLLILDNVDTFASIYDLLPATHRGHLLLTTRMQMTGTFAQALTIETMNPQEGADFVLRRAKIIDLHADTHEIDEDDRRHAHTLAETLGGLPLALDQAGAYIEETACGLVAYLRRYQQSHTEQLQRRGGFDLLHPEPISMTWLLAFENVAQSNADAIALLRLLAFLAPDGIPLEIITQGCASLEKPLATLAENPVELDEAIGNLRRFSLIQRVPAVNMLSLHRLVQVVLLDRMSMEEQRAWAEVVVRALCVVFPSGEFETWQQCDRLLSQALMGIELARHWKIISLESARLTRRAANYLRNRGRHADAERLYKQALALYEATSDRFESGSAEVASCLYEMGALSLMHKGFDETLALFQRALTMQQLNPDDLLPDQARTLDSIGEAYYYQKEYDQAEDYFRRALTIRQAIFGPDHSVTAESLNNIGILLLKCQRKYEAAAEVFQQVLAIMIKERGHDHRDVGICMLNLATTYREQGVYEQAREWYLQTLALWRRVLGEEDTDVAFALNSLAKMYVLQAEVGQAEATYLQALAIYEKARGPEHRDTRGVRRELEELREKSV